MPRAAQSNRNGNACNVAPYAPEDGKHQRLKRAQVAVLVTLEGFS